MISPQSASTTKNRRLQWLGSRSLIINLVHKHHVNFTKIAEKKSQKYYPNNENHLLLKSHIINISPFHSQSQFSIIRTKSRHVEWTHLVRDYMFQRKLLVFLGERCVRRLVVNTVN